jgi:pyruvate-formate lyase
MEETTQIQIKVWTREALKQIGKKGESYDDVIVRLIKNYKIYVED